MCARFGRATERFVCCDEPEVVRVAVDGNVKFDPGFVDRFAVAEVVDVVSCTAGRLDVVVVEIAVFT